MKVFIGCDYAFDTASKRGQPTSAVEDSKLYLGTHPNKDAYEVATPDTDVASST